MEQHLSWCKGIAQVQIQEHVTALFLITKLIRKDGCVAMIRTVTVILRLPAYLYSYFKNVKIRKANILSA